ncbi:hypothetical protein LT493_12320 [Streptomyces tricolor]|nr:hypothetical protein [Streptomyces tricolor]
MLGTGDVLVVLLGPDAGQFSVPSKTLSYLCAGRPVLGLMPADNLAARLLRQAGSAVFPPEEPALEGAAAWVRGGPVRPGPGRATGQGEPRAGRAGVRPEWLRLPLRGHPLQRERRRRTPSPPLKRPPRVAGGPAPPATGRPRRSG